MSHRLPNPFNPADVWTPDDLRRCLVERVEPIVDVSVSRSIDGELASRPEARVVTVVVTVWRSAAPTSADVDVAKRHALELVALGCPPHVSATVTARVVNKVPDPPARPESEVPRRRAEMTGLEGSRERSLPPWARWPRATHALALGCGVLVARIVEAL